MALYSLKADADGMMIARLGRLEDALPYTVPGGFAGNLRAGFRIAVGDATTAAGIVSTTNASGVQIVGSLPATVADGQFAATFTDTQVHWYWDGTNGSRVFALRRPSAINQPVPPGDLLITGLTASTKYAFFPFWSPFNNCTIGWPQGDAGTPQIAFSPSATATQIAQALAQQTMLAYEALSGGAMTITTAAAAGSGSGTAGGGGDGTTGCVMLSTDIEPLGEHSPDSWRNEHFPCSEWLRLQTHSGRTLNCTPDHPLYDADSGKVAAESLRVGRWAITAQGEERITENAKFLRLCTKVKTLMDAGHLYYANGFLSHNVKNPGSVK